DRDLDTLQALADFCGGSLSRIQSEQQLHDQAIERELREAARRCERERADAALRESEALYHSLVSHLSQCVFRKDQAGRFTFGNEPFCRLLEKTPAEILGRTDFDLVPRELAEKYRQDDLRVM